mmetsp:Transcript_45615/g.110513  ORF Transcript_45615/g.110513 Transcript_45615/m.110513 type:complete len:281 (-) Transcript_45615:603-1445(-)
MDFGLGEVILVLPVQAQGPGLVSEVVADKIEVTSINQSGVSSVQKVTDVATEIGHPVMVELHVDAIVARIPVMRVLFIDVQSLLGRFQVQELADHGEIVAKWRVLTFLADIVGVQSCGLVGTSQSKVACNKGSLASKIRNWAVTTVAFMNQSGALWNCGLHGFVNRLRHNRNVMRVVVDHLWIPLVLLFGVGESISNGETGIAEFNCSLSLLLIALPDTVSNSWYIMATIRFSNNVEGTLRILRMGLEESLQKVVGIFGNHLFSSIAFGSVRISNTSGLV